jgi:hypothetical protein
MRLGPRLLVGPPAVIGIRILSSNNGLDRVRLLVEDIALSASRISAVFSATR